MKKSLLLSAIALFSVIIVGCAGHQYNVKTVKYVQQTPTNENETRVFVFRISNFTGSGNRFAIINNDTIVGTVGSGEFMSFIAKGNKNLVAAIIPTAHEDSAQGYFYFEGQKKKEMYLQFKLAMGEDLGMKEISKEEAHILMNKYDYQEFLEFPKPKWRANLLKYYERLQQQTAN
ncbi:MAG: hypothetical protein K8S13_14355 [Desulfobacula sp.]|uniref:hypothetical protein n=1 Tax=Desulfobacula sp. TaxID=2593537 RepID=UPI0025C68AF5|nr:hypothetical protein [Desulfobacula sp.]MCD4721018.1 hypothetical protein [Desulfobacula sp.]